MKKFVIIMLIVAMGISQQKEIDMPKGYAPSQGKAEYKPPAAPKPPPGKGLAPAPKVVNRKQKDDDAYVPAWLGSGLGNEFVYQQQQNNLNKAFGMPVQATNIPGTTVPLQSSPQMTKAPTIFNPRTGQTGSDLQLSDILEGLGSSLNSLNPQGETITNPRTGQTGNNLQLSDVVLGMLEGVGSSTYVPPGLSQEQRAAVEEALKTRPTQYAPRENIGNFVGSLMKNRASQYAPRENIGNYLQYLAAQEETTPDYGFGTSYGGNWRGGGGGGYSAPAWLDPRYLNLYDWRWRS